MNIIFEVISFLGAYFSILIFGALPIWILIIEYVFSTNRTISKKKFFMRILYSFFISLIIFIFSVGIRAFYLPWDNYRL